ncbi:peptidase M50, membrane-associated zinc metallopeptidase [Salinisphaera sp. PC39]|uniref:RIP metalloprotease RseP n=1 Tax=Salinisphaera sp. PC39 TaxID=1304156 RepID=UPI003342728B
MPDWLLSVPAFIVAIGLLVAVHEYGHFWVARRMGVRVLRYSIGFGAKLWGRTSSRSGTEYWLSAIPLGGYVKMLDEREGPVPDADKPYAFNRQSVGKRMAIVAAGPAVNFAFAIVAYWLVFMLGVAGIKPVIGDVPEDTRAAAAGLSEGQHIVAVAGRETPTWQDLRLTLIEQALAGGEVPLSVTDGEGGDAREVRLDMTGVSADPERLFGELGLAPYRPDGTPVIAEALSGEPADAAGLRAGDKVLAAGGEPMRDPQALVDWVKAHPGETVSLRIRRDGREREVRVSLDAMTVDGERVGRLGAQLGIDSDEWAALQTERRLGPLAAVPAALEQTWSVSALTVRLMGRMLVGDVSWKNISGPIQIANYAGKTASVGLEAFIGFLALVSVSLAVLNLLPVPVLDGGHLLYYAIELVRGRPLSEEAQAMGQQLGMVALLLLMSLAFYNDILRLLS